METIENFSTHLNQAIKAYEKLQYENSCLRTSLHAALDNLNGATYCFTRGEIGAAVFVSDARNFLRAALTPNAKLTGGL